MTSLIEAMDVVNNFMSKTIGEFVPTLMSYRKINPRIVKNIPVINRVDQDTFNKGLFMNRYWTFDFIETISNYIDLTNIKTVLDIGSRDCFQSVEFTHWFPDAKVYAFEANPEQINLCRRVASINPNIYVVPKAASNTNGPIVFNVSDSNVGASSLLKITDHPRSSGWKQREVRSEAVRVDNWCQWNNIPSIDLLWVDVQGSEKMVFEGVGDYLKNVKAIATEVNLAPMYSGCILKPQLDQLLAQHGFIQVAAYHMAFDAISESDLALMSGEADIFYVNKNFMGA
jgi:FkbM family methyltransferase